MTELKEYAGEREQVAALIAAFWQCHNNCTPNPEEAMEDLNEWTKEGHRFYFIQFDGQPVGFVHLGSRGAECDWLEDLFVLPAYQRRGIGRAAVGLAENIVREYSESLYMEAAARNEGAIRLYHALGYDCLNTITVRKDFQPERFKCVKTEHIHDRPFEIRKIKETM